MFAVLLVLAWLLLTLVVAIHRKWLGVGQCLREAVIVAAVLCATLVVVFTELLSLATLLSRGPVLVCWMGVDLVLFGWVVAQRRQLRGWLSFGPRLSLGEWVLLGLCGSLVALTGLVAAVSPPNNWDAMLYHLPRQVHWIQQASVAHFPTAYLLQTGMPPLAEFIGVHLMILSGGDGWANLVQWFALVLTLVAVSLIARDLGLSRSCQLLSALFVATIPVAFLQAMNTKNDLVVSLWLCSAAWWCVRLWAEKPWNLTQSVLCGLTLGLLALTKGTGLLFAVPVLAVGGLGLLIKQRPLAVKAGLLVAAAVVLLNLGHSARNYLAYHSIVGPHFSPEFANASHQPPAILSNIVRNLALHLANPSEDLDARLQEGIVRLHDWLGIDASDSRTTFNERFCIAYNPYNEDKAPAPVHVLIIGLLTLSLPFYLRRVNLATRMYLLIPLGCCFLFCYHLKWQPWHVRLQLPIFCLFAAVLGGVCAGRWGKPVAVALVAGCLLALAPAIYLGAPKTLFTDRSVLRHDRVNLMFIARPELREGMQETADELARLQPASIGLFNFFGEWEYALERLVLDRVQQRPFFSSFPPCPPEIANVPERYTEAPDVVVGIRSAPSVLIHAPTGKEYVAARYCMPFTLYLPRERAQEAPIAVSQFPFYGWEALDGWTPLEGPTWVWGLPVVRWGLGPASRLSFESDGRPLQLLAECRGNCDLVQKITLRLNGALIHEHVLAKPLEFAAFHVRMLPRPGTNELILEYSGQTPPPGQRLGVAFRKLTILPALDHGSPSAAGEGAQPGKPALLLPAPSPPALSPARP